MLLFKIEEYRRLVRVFCYNIPKRTHVTPFLNANDVQKMHYRRILHLMYQTVYKQSPTYLYNKLIWVRDAHSKNT